MDRPVLRDKADMLYFMVHQETRLRVDSDTFRRAGQV